MERYHIIIFGDSITYGAWDKQKGGWVNRLRMAYENNGQDHRYNIFNLGISGEVTKEVKARFENECMSRFNPENKNIIIFAIGINDAQIDHGRERTLIEEFQTDIFDLIHMAKKYTNNILFIGLTNVDESRVCPIPWHPEKYYYNHQIKQFDNVLKNLCLENHVHYLPVYGLLENSDLHDGLHPNEVGHQKLCDVIKNTIDTLL